MKKTRLTTMEKLTESRARVKLLTKAIRSLTRKCRKALKCSNDRPPYSDIFGKTPYRLYADDSFIYEVGRAEGLIRRNKK